MGNGGAAASRSEEKNAKRASLRLILLLRSAPPSSSSFSLERRTPGPERGAKLSLRGALPPKQSWCRPRWHGVTRRP